MPNGRQRNAWFGTGRYFHPKGLGAWQGKGWFQPVYRHPEIAEPLKEKFQTRWISKGIINVWTETLPVPGSGRSFKPGNGYGNFIASLAAKGVTDEVKLPR